MFGSELNLILIVIIAFETILISFLVCTVYFKLNKIYKKNTDFKLEFNDKIEKISSKLNKYIFTPPPPPPSEAKLKHEISPLTENTAPKEKTIQSSSSSSQNSNFSQLKLEEKIAEIKTEILAELDRFKSIKDEGIDNNTDNKKSKKSTTTTPLYNITYISSVKHEDKSHLNPMDIITNIPSQPPSSLTSPVAAAAPPPFASLSLTDTINPSDVNGHLLYNPPMNYKDEKMNPSNRMLNIPPLTSSDSNSQNFNDVITPSVNADPGNNQNPSVEEKSDMMEDLQSNRQQYTDNQADENSLNKIADSSSPELQKIEEEILTALKRLGEVKNNFSTDNSN